MKADSIAKLQHLLQTMAFCLAVATLQYVFQPERPYAPPVAYSLTIGFITWAIIDLGRDLFPSARETGWPTGATGLLLVAGGIAVGYLLGTAIADAACRTFGWYQGEPVIDRSTALRNNVLITVLAGIVATYYFYSRNKSFYLERKMTEARQHANEARLKLLESQLEPHMLFNTLANLRVLIGIDAARAQTMLDHMIAYLRATLGASRASSHALQAEFDRLQDYLALMAIRMGPRLQFTLELPPELADVHVPALLLQPLVENSIQHGLEPKVTGGSVRVRALREGEALLIEVSDTGVGTAAGPSTGAGFGLQQVRERLAAVYGPAARLEFETRAGAGACSRIRLPWTPPP